MPNILIIEDEKPIARLVELALRHEGYGAEIQYDGEAGLQSVLRKEPDLILLDLMLPGMDGLEVCSRVRAFSAVPILILTAKSETEDKVLGLDTGANDYITKPFEIDELLARVRAALRGGAEAGEKSPVMEIGDLRIDFSRRIVKRGEATVPLTRREFTLLAYLARNKGVVLTRDQILDRVWGMDYEGEANVVDVYIRYLRGKIDDPFERKLIHTARGFGYVLEETDP